MKLPLILCFLCGFYISAIAQPPSAKIFDKRFGGTGEDGFNSFIQTKDGGYILGGESLSPVSGDKTQPDWDTTLSTNDYWIIKIDSVGNKEWEKRFGGLSDDELSTVIQSSDGNYMLEGISLSGIGGDKTQPAWGGGDYWVIKVDSQGNKLWDKRFGGTLLDEPEQLLQAKDRGYTMVGFSNSGIGGDKTQPNWDTTESNYDYWVVKIDSVGNKQWDKRYGGIGDDFASSIVQTRDGGYIIGGTSRSDSSGDKTQPTWNSTDDYWIIKIDSAGNKEWDKDFGGSGFDWLNAIGQTNDGGFIIGGYSNSPADGNKSQSDIDTTGQSNDYWIVKIDSAGNKQWDKDFGGLKDDNLQSVSQTFDDGYLLSGHSSSNAGGDKVENNLGYIQVWLIKTDSSGKKQWDKTILTTGFDWGYAIQTKDSCYAVGVHTNAGIGGYKTQPDWDTTDSTDDYWIVKFCFTGFGEGIKEPTTNLQLNIYPNPFTSELDISIAQPNLKQADFSICNILGQTVYTQHETNLSPTYTKMLDLSYLPNGVYLVEVVVDGEVSVREVVKQ